ncbi:hypothetical protein M422DRAFT_241404 [Sphaerobolus stellatus SS14]|nr:hypothetical protein M422DRAFT_241404 [Sphaerobolus stellatus SS14]
MSVLSSFPPSPEESNEDHTHFFAQSDDDAETASQRSISLSSEPEAPSALALETPVVAAATSPKTAASASPVPAAVSSESPTRSAREDHHEDHDTRSFTETAVSGPSSSFKFSEEGHTRQSSLSSSTSFFARDDVSSKSLVVDTSYPPPSQAIVPVDEFGYAIDRRTADGESLASARTTGSTASSGRKVRPESLLLPTSSNSPVVLGIALVDFNHIVGPRVEFFEGSGFEDDEVVRILPFLALPDGAHLNAEDYSYFHLVPTSPKPSTIFGISCNRQIQASELLSKGDDVTRSTVQKAVVVLASKPIFGAVRDKLGVVTNALFNQRDFRDMSILSEFASSLETSLRNSLTESSLYMGTSLRELVHTFRHRTLILLKALMLQKKIMFYGHPVERLCTYQYSLISLVPYLLQTLEDCGSPPLASRAPTLSRPSSLKSSDRKSLLNFVGLPLDIFGKDAFFQPYLPLQQVDIAKESQSWLCGCTNSIVYTQSNYDILVNIEANTFEFKDTKLEKIVALTPADRKWIDDIVKDVNESWNDGDPTRPTSMQFKGSDDYLRTKFEEYISALLSTVKYSDFLAKGANNGVLISEGYDPNAQYDFGSAWITAFKGTHAFDVWNRVTDPVLFDIIEPRHPCVDKPSAVTDIGLQLSESIRDLKIDQQLAPTREAISHAITSGSTNFFKAVDGIKGRWNARSASSTSLHTASSTSTEDQTAKAPSNGIPESVPTISTPTSPLSSSNASINSIPTGGPSLPPRPPSVIAAEAKAALGAFGSGIGSFFSARTSRFSFSRNNSSTTSVASTPSVASVKEMESPVDVIKEEVPEDHTRGLPPTPTTATPFSKGQNKDAEPSAAPVAL